MLYYRLNILIDFIDTKASSEVGKELYRFTSSLIYPISILLEIFSACSQYMFYPNRRHYRELLINLYIISRPFLRTKIADVSTSIPTLTIHSILIIFGRFII
jgi:hypothetical protein